MHHQHSGAGVSTRFGGLGGVEGAGADDQGAGQAKAKVLGLDFHTEMLRNPPEIAKEGDFSAGKGKITPEKKYYALLALFCNEYGALRRGDIEL
jgi:hypothetical protein